jgi:hypothetical protein
MLRRLLRRYHPDLIALGLYILLTGVLTWPMLCQMSTHLIGQSTDTYINPWANWWTEKAIREHLPFYFTDYMFYPYGVSLTLHSFSHFNTLLWFILRPLMGNLPAYNTTVLVTYPLSAYGMFALVRYLTRSTRAGFIAGLIFAFSPYHMAESVHPVLVTTQWLPLFMLYTIKVIRSRDRQILHALLALLFLWLTGLSSWHLLVFALMLAATYAIYSLVAERRLWDWRTVLVLAGVALGCGVLLAPLAYPMFREQLLTNTPYLAVPVQLAEGNDLLSFVLPGPYHPVLGRFTAPVHERFKLAGRRPAYLGFAALGLALVGLKVNRRSTVYWGLAGLLFLVLSLGPYVKIYGFRLHDFVLPWAIPFAGFFRNLYRFNILISFCLAVLAGWGAAYWMEHLSHRQRTRPTLLTAGLAIVILLEYLSIPMPRTELRVSPFYYHLASEDDSIAIVEFPLGRRRDKEYMYYQTIHGKRTVNGQVSRTPQDAYRFLDEVPILSALYANEPPAWSSRHLFAQLAPLVREDITYIVLHRQWFDPGQLEEWGDYIAFPPTFEDDQIIVYRTQYDMTPAAHLTPELALMWVGTLHGPVRQGDTLCVRAVWKTERSPSNDWELDVRLQNEAGITAQQVSMPLRPDHPTTAWPPDAAIRGDYTFQVDPHLPPGRYRLTLALAPLSGSTMGEESALVGVIDIQPLERNFTAPSLEHETDAVFGRTLTLLGYAFRQDPDAVHITLYWQALRRMDFYKIFVHLYDVQTGTLIAQQDTVPHGWAYPTNWWEAGEVVSDEIALPLEGILAGRYRIAVGVYEPDTLQRLPVQTAGDVPLGDYLELEETVLVPAP